MQQHKADYISLTFGGLFVGLAFLLPAGHWVDWRLADWAIPAAVVLLGIGIAVSAVATTRRQRNQSMK